MADGPDLKKFFEYHWEEMLLWAILAGLFVLLQPFLLLIFETFLITYIMKGAVEWSVRRLALNYRVATVGWFALFVGLLCAAGAWLGPQFIAESNQILADLATDGDQRSGEKTNRLVEQVVQRLVGEEKARAVIGSEEYALWMTALKAEAVKTVKAALPRVLDGLLHLVKVGWEIVVSLLLAILFSFILVMDWRRIAAGMRTLETSHLRSFYLGAAPHARAFADVLGKAFRAQALIAVCNTVLTALGLMVFGVPNIVLLSAIVFLCGFIPIFGAFLSSLPILLFGAQIGGLPLVVKLTALVAGVHLIEAYVLNPRITAGALHVHPILVLILLLIGERFFGVWGMVLGVPIGYYVIRALAAQDATLSAQTARDEPAD